MNTDLIITIIAFIIFLLFSGFFSSSETAITALGRIKARSLADQNIPEGIILTELLKKPRQLLTGILIGNNIANVAASALATAVSLKMLEQFGISNVAISLTIVTILMTVIVLIFGEITPKSIVLKNPAKWALIYAKPLKFTLFILHPFVIVFHGIAVMIGRLLGGENSDSIFLSAGDLKAMVDMGNEEGILEEEERDMIHSIMEFSDTVVREVMTPRTDAICVDVECSIREAIQIISKHGHSRIPVYEEDIDNVIGILYAKDLLGISSEDHHNNLRKFIRDAHFIPESKSIESLFHQMKRTFFHMAIVVDEHGGFSGLVTLEDIIEEITGDINDEYDPKGNPEILDLGNGSYVVDAKMSVYDFAKAIQVSIPDTEDYDTVGGFTLSLFDRFPKRGDSVVYDCLTIKINAIKRQRILKLDVLKQ